MSLLHLYKGVMFYKGDPDTLTNLVSIPGEAWFPHYWRPNKTPQEVEDKVLYDENWDIACIIEDRHGHAMSRRDFLSLSRP